MPLAHEVFKEKSNENWKAGKLCEEGGFLNAAANRFYYALYQAAVSWGDREGHLPYTGWAERHDLVRQTVGQSAGSCAKELRECLNNMFALRTKADYKPVPLRRSELTDKVRQASAARATFLRK